MNYAINKISFVFAIKPKTLTLKRVHNVDDKSDKSSLRKTSHPNSLRRRPLRSISEVYVVGYIITTNIYFFIILNILSMRELRLFRIFPRDLSGNYVTWPLSLGFVFKLFSTFIGQNLKLFFMHVLTKDVLGL